jgi:hypothetical protein
MTLPASAAHGGEVRIIVIDPKRAPIIRWAFETYATGLLVCRTS